MAKYFLDSRGMGYGMATSIEPRFECTVEIRPGGEVASASGWSGKHKNSAATSPPSRPEQAPHRAAARYAEVDDDAFGPPSPPQQRVAAARYPEVIEASDLPSPPQQRHRYSSSLTLIKKF